jgi:hypothetical protein
MQIQYWTISTRACPQGGPPADINQCGEFIYRDAQAGLKLGDHRQFLASLIPGAPVCFVVHGSFISWETVVEDSEATYRWLRSAAPEQPINIVFFTWPSDSNLSYLVPLDVAILAQRAGYQSLYLGQLIAQLPPELPISLVGHSLGARTVASTMQLVSTGQSEGFQVPQLMGQPRRVRAVMAAGAVEHHTLNPGERYGGALAGSEALLNLRNSNDLVLALYPLHRPFGMATLGQVGWTQRDRWQLGEWNNKIVELELAPLLDTKHLWEHYYRRPGLATVMAPYVYFSDSPPDYARRQPAPQRNAAAVRPQQVRRDSTLSLVRHPSVEPRNILPGLNLNVRLPARR